MQRSSYGRGSTRGYAAPNNAEGFRRNLLIFGGLAVLLVAILIVLIVMNRPSSSPSSAAASPTTVPQGSAATPATGQTGAQPTQAAAQPAQAAVVGTGRMTIDTAKGQIVLELYNDPADKVMGTVINFAKKANAGYFDGLTFHRVEDWVIQGGDPKGDGTGGGSMPAEYNNIPFTAGSLGVARDGDPTINNDSQFFIVKTDYPSLNSLYTNWGRVASGMDVVNKIAVGDKITKIRVTGVDTSVVVPTPTSPTSGEPAHITVEHVLIGFKDAVGFQGNPPAKAAARTQDQAKTLAYDLLNQIKNGANFEQLMSQYSDDTGPGKYSLANNGVTADQATQEYPRSGMVPAFGNVGFGLKVGEVGMADYDPQNSPFGYHIIKRLK